MPCSGLSSGCAGTRVRKLETASARAGSRAVFRAGSSAISSRPRVRERTHASSSPRTGSPRGSGRCHGGRSVWKARAVLRGPGRPRDQRPERGSARCGEVAAGLPWAPWGFPGWCRGPASRVRALLGNGPLPGRDPWWGGSPPFAGGSALPAPEGTLRLTRRRFSLC